MSEEEKYAYEKLMADNELTIETLPADAQASIKILKNLENAAAALVKKGKPVTEEAIKAMEVMDKHIVSEVWDYINDTQKAPEEVPVDYKKVIEKMKEEEKAETPEQVDPLGVAIEAELENLFKGDKREWPLPELAAVAPKAYDALFKAHKPNEENGIQTSKYTLLETDPETKLFTLSKN